MVVAGHGGVDRLQLQERPDPPVGPHEVRVRVKAVALNRLDVWVREGWKGLDLEMPHILGSDVAGVVDAVGEGVIGVHERQEVLLGPGTSCGTCGACLSGLDHRCPRYAILGEHRSGGYAELLTVPARNVFPKPKNLSMAEAACLPLVFTTAWGMLVERGRLSAGETVLVQAAGSGVGSMAIQIAKLCGARVITTAGSAEKLARAAELGADHGIDYSSEDVVERVRELTDGRGVDLVIEHVGGDVFRDSLKALAVGGRLVTCGATSGPKAQIDIRAVFWRHLSIIGSTMGSLGSMVALVQHAEAGRLRPVLDSVLPLEAAPEAHRRLAARDHFGKLVLTP
jgi:NADPH:quinone reductase-like Zn-dependent oxidoreductase